MEYLEDFQYIYFIENHKQDSPVNIYLDKKSSEAYELEKVHHNLYEQNQRFIYTIYRFKIFNQKYKKNKNLEIKIILEDINETKFESRIFINYLTDRSIFIYDLKFGKVSLIEPPLSINFSHIQQFEIYINYIRKKLKLKQNDKESIDLIISTQRLLIDPEKKYSFSFFIVVFLECIFTNIVQKHLYCFRPDKIESIGELSEINIKKISNILKTIEKKTEKILDNIANNVKDEYGIKLFTIILFFNYNFERSGVQELLNNENKNNKKYLFQGLIDKNYSVLFNNLKLTKAQIQILINLSKDFMQLTISIKYCKDLLELLQIICENFEKYCELYKLEINNINNKKAPSIDIKSIIEIHKNDDIKEISKLYIDLIKKQNEFGYIFLIFDISLCQKYIGYFEGINIDKLLSVKEIVYFMKAPELKDVNRIIHDTGLSLSKAGKLKNIDILNFISKDVYYNCKDYKRIIYRPLYILDSLDIKSFNEEFYFAWKLLDWYNIFDEQYNDFLNKIANLIINIKDFNILFTLFDLSKDKYNHDYNANSLNTMQKRFVQLQKTFELKYFQNFKDNLIKLIFYSDQNKANLEEFLINNIQKIINIELLNDIYIEFSFIYKDLISSSTKDIILKFYINNLKKFKPKSLLNIIRNFPELSQHILKNINKYTIQKEDFLSLEETDNLKLFKGLLDQGFIKDEKYHNIYYFQNSIFIVNNLENEINKGELLYGNIIKFNNNIDKENKLYSRLILISLNSDKDAKKYLEKINYYCSTINRILKDLHLIREYFLEFYYSTEKENIEKIENIIKEIENGKLNCYEKKYFSDIENLKLKYNERTKEKFFIKKSNYFKTIFNINKLIYKNDDKKCMFESEQHFLKLKILFTKGIQYLGKTTLEFCLLTVRGKKEIDIEHEIDILIKIFEKEINQVYDKEKIINFMILLSKKEEIYSIALILSLFIEKSGIFRGNLLAKIKCFDFSNNEVIINKYIEELKNKELKENNVDECKNNIKIEQLNKELNKEINQLKNELNLEKIKNQKLNEKIIELQNIINKKEDNEIKEKYNYGYDNKNDLIEDIKKKEKEIYELREIFSRFPNKSLEKEHILSIIIISKDEDIYYSLICKNTDKFIQIENNFYEKYPEYMESEGIFMFNNNNIKRYKSIEENNIHNNDIIIFHKPF